MYNVLRRCAHSDEQITEAFLYVYYYGNMEMF